MIMATKNLMSLRNLIGSRCSGFTQVAQFATVPEDPVTHTGQQFDKDDYRLARFVDKKKEVNPNFAITLINKVPPIKRNERVVWCEGGGGPLGHPKVYINLDKPGNHSCNYCGLRFTKEDHHH